MNVNSYGRKPIYQKLMDGVELPSRAEADIKWPPARYVRLNVYEKRGNLFSALSGAV